MHRRPCYAWNWIARSSQLTYELNPGRLLTCREAGIVRRQVPADDEEDLLRCLRKRDEAAFRELVGRYKDEVGWIVTRMIGRMLSEDMTQEVFLRVYESIPGFRGDASLRTWINRIAYNLCVSYLRHQSRAQNIPLEDMTEEALFHLLPASDSPQVESMDLSRLIEKAMAQLPPKYRAIITFYYNDRLKYHEIAEIMGIPIGTVKTYLHRARLRLRSYLLRHGCKPSRAGTDHRGGG